MEESISGIEKQELSQLKELVLQSIFNQNPFPGSITPLNFPDLQFVISQPEIYLLDQDIKGNIFIPKLKKSVLIKSEDTIENIATKLGKVVYLKFQTTGLERGMVVLNLQAKIQSSFPNKQKSNLTSMQMKFRRINNEWEIIDQPISLSS